MRLTMTRTVLLSGVCLLGLAGCSEFSYRYPTYSPVDVAVPQPDPLVRSTQLALIRLGYLHDVADGFYGPRTRAAIQSFQLASGYPVSGTVSWSLMSELNSPAAMVASASPLAAPVVDAPKIMTSAATATGVTTNGSQWVQPPKAEALAATPPSPAPAKTASEWILPAKTP
jgi:peptidoglycan hydrolase-like protein with peptidoglycan-binding domain